jgi:hypothetical protein
MGKKHHCHTMDEGGGNLASPSVRRSYNSSSSPHGQVVTTMDHITGVEGSHHKYVKPRVGFQFQARVSSQSSSQSTSTKHSNAISNGTFSPIQRPGRGRGRGRGRPPGRPPKKPSLSTSTSSSSLGMGEYCKQPITRCNSAFLLRYRYRYCRLPLCSLAFD